MGIINLKEIKFPHLIISDDQNNPIGTLAEKGYFRENLLISWNDKNRNINSYYLADNESKYANDINKNYLIYKEKSIDLSTILNNEILNYSIYYKDNGILINTPIQTGIISKENSSFKFSHNFSEVKDNHKISLILKIYESNKEQDAIFLDDNVYLKKMEKPKIITSFEVTYSKNNTIKPLSNSSGIAANISFGTPIIHGGISTNEIKYQISLNNSLKFLQVGTLADFSEGVQTSLILQLSYNEIFNKNIAIILSNNEAINPNTLNDIYRSQSLYLIIQDKYGISNKYLISDNISFDYREAPYFNNLIPGTKISKGKIGIDYLKPSLNDITWESQNVFANLQGNNNRLINEGEYIITSFNEALDLNENDKIYYEIHLLSSNSNDPNDLQSYSEENIDLIYWSNNSDENCSQMFNGLKYGINNITDASKNFCIPIQIKSIGTKKFYRTYIKIFNIEKGNFNTRIYSDQRIESETYLVGLPTSNPNIKIKNSSVPEFNFDTSPFQASTSNHGEGEIYTASIHEWYDTYPNFERQITYKNRGQSITFIPKAEMNLQYSTNKDIPEDEGWTIEENLKTLYHYTNNGLVINLLRNLSTITNDKTKMPRLFFRIKLIIQSGLEVVLENGEQKIRPKTYTSYSNVIIYYPSGPTVSHRFHSVGINQEKVGIKNVLDINLYGKDKSCIQLNGLKGLADTNLIFDLNGGILTVSDSNNFDFLISTTEIDDLFK